MAPETREEEDRMQIVGRSLGVVFAALALSACATSFTGSPYVEEGRAGCERKCKGDGMDVAGMVYMGEYSSACVCAVPGRTAQGRQQLLASASVAAGAAGVEMQKRRQEQNNNGAMMTVR
jgi:hypothetical protein